MGLVMYGWQLESILSRFAARFGHTNHSLAAAASPDVRFWLNLCGACASQVCVRVCVCVGVCECVCGTFKICSYRYECATHRAQVHKGVARAA